MKLTKVQFCWSTVRAVLITVSVILLMAAAIKAHSWNLEMEYVGPGSEAERLNEAIRDRDNEEAHERCQEGRGSERDQERARDWERDHCA